MLNAPLNFDAMMNPVHDVASAACGFFEVVEKFCYPVVTQVFLKVEFLLARLLLVCNSNKTPCFGASW